MATAALAPRPAGLMVRAFSTRIVPASSIVRAMADDVRVVWSSNDLVVVGIGVAREVRGHGVARWQQVVDATHRVRQSDTIKGSDPISSSGCRTAKMGSDPISSSDCRPADFADVAVELDGARCTVEALGFARPRLLGGAAFAVGAADRAPWIGFGDAWFVLPRWSYVSNGVRAMFVLAADVDDDRWSAELTRFQAVAARMSTEPVGSSKGQPPPVELQPAPADAWRAQVTAITDAIARGESSKVVAARTCHLALAGAIDVAALLDTLDERHPDCVRVLVRPPGAGTLIAATPERLVRRDGRSVSCDALAGTINATVDDARAKLLASAKDRREHALVVDAVRAALTDVGATIDAPSEPAIRALRHVMHLHTPFAATLREPHHVLELVARLHPTPAVGGTPTSAAIEWIRTHEPVARGWYASPVGWFDLDGNGEFAVAIRSGVIAGNRAHLWAGAGIVAGSDPDRELAETDAKLRAMLGALGVTT